MSSRHFEGADHASLYRKYREKPPPALIERIIQFLKEKYDGPLNQAVDLGCGTGQCTFMLAKYFDRVLGTDISVAQIKEAEEESQEQKLSNVQFCVCPAEKVDLKDQSVQLITACAAAHWFDLDKVYEEGKRLLSPGGVMAFLCYFHLVIDMDGDEVKKPEFAKIMDRVHEYLLPYFPPLATMALNKYKDVVIPYHDLTREYDYGVTVTSSVSTILGSIKTFSAYQNFLKDKGDEEADKFMNDVKTRLLEVAKIKEADMDEKVLTVTRQYFVVMARV